MVHPYLESFLGFDHCPDDEWRPIQEHCSNEFSVLLTFVPLYLQRLYHHLFINRSDESDSLPFVVLLAQRSLYFEDINVADPNFDSSLEEFKSQCKKHFLENYFFVLLTIHSKKESHQTTNEFILSDDLEKLIRVECQRISDANQLPQGQDKDCRLFAASISLARLFQIQSYSTSYNSTTNNNLSSFPIECISHPILRLIAWHFISEIQNSFSSDRKQREDLDLQIIHLFKNVQNVPLLTFTFLIVRFYHQRKDVRMIYLISKMIGERFREYNDKHKDIKEVVSITLKQFGHLDYLSKSFDPTQWNPSLLFQYFNQQTSFQSLDNTFQSLIYITELAFDAHVFQVYVNDGDYHQMFDLQILISQKIMTYKAARWITNYLRESWNEDILDQVIKVVFKCLTVEEKALTMIEEWCIYRYENKLKLLAQYAALQLFIYRSNYPDLIGIINEI